MRLLWVVLLSACLTVEPSRRHETITGGEPEPGYLAVFALAWQGQGGCTGTCITPRVGTTAAHCIEPGDVAADLTALFGDDEFSPSQVIQVTAFAKEPGGADLALVAFAEACPATIPVNRTPLEDHVGEPVVMVGFGVTTEDADDAGVKRSGTATLFSVNPAQVSGMEAGELATSNDPDGTCNGDSGGPTFMTFAGVEYMVGTTSRGSLMPGGTMEYPCGQGRSIAVRADTYADFIDDFIAVHDPGAADQPDAGAPPTGQPDAGAPPTGQPDAGDPGVDEGDSSGGCGCRAGERRAPAGALLILALALVAVRFRQKV
jgi:MYXO-CTERM domain-containing protein